MKHNTNESPTSVAPRHGFETLAPVAGSAHRFFRSAVMTVITAAAVALPLQAPADAASISASAASTAVSGHVSLSVGGARNALSSPSVSVRHYSRSTYESRLHIWANRMRRSHGVHGIAVRPCHEGYAERWTGYLARTSEFRHQDLGAYMTRCKLTKAGEILALGSVTPVQMVRMWMNSPAHRAILLDRSFGLSGIAARRDANGTWIGCIDFGRR